MIKGLFLRKCDVCDKGMDEGYHDGENYYCSDKCLHMVYTPEQWADVATDDSDECYYTEWHDFDGDDTVYTKDGTEYTLTEE